MGDKVVNSLGEGLKYLDECLNLYDCTEEDCEKTFKTCRQLRKHFHNVHSLRQYDCEYEDCDKTFGSKCAQQTHHFSHTNQWPLSCDFTGCEYRSRTLSSLRTHQIENHSNGRVVLHREYRSRQYFDGCLDTDLNQYLCPKKRCLVGGKRFPTRNQFTDHMRRVHPKRRYVCDMDECGHTCDHMRQMDAHLDSHNSEDIFTCGYSDCGLSYATNQALRQHLRVHQSIQTYVCTEGQCRQRFRKASELTSHRFGHKPQPKYRCDETACREVFAHKRQLKAHKLQEHPVRRIYVPKLLVKCDWPDCGYSGDRTHLQSHRNRIHLPLVCDRPHCGQRFASEDELRAHYEKHRMDEPYQCSYGCDMWFKSERQEWDHCFKCHLSGAYRSRQRYRQSRRNV